MARVLLPVVVDGVEDGVAGYLGGAAGGVEDVDVLESDELEGTGVSSESHRNGLCIILVAE